jgi:HSP20 family protein
MALIRWEPTREIESLQQEVNRLFGSFFDARSPGQEHRGTGRHWVPAVDLVEEGERYVLRADLPGVEPQDVKVELEDDVLTVSGRRETESENDDGGVHRRERAFGSFTRRLTLPAGVDADSIEASFHQGVLEVRIPKPVQPQPRQVAIKVGAKAPVIEGTETAAEAHAGNAS